MLNARVLAGVAAKRAAANREDAVGEPYSEATDFMLRIYLLGALRILADEQPLKFSVLPKTLPLLVFLLLRRAHPTPREQLAFTFWPDVSEGEAKANLRRHLHDLRRALPDGPAWVLADSDGVQWNPSAPFWLDVAAFEQGCADFAGRAEAVALYTGDLLPNLYEDWLAPERDRLRELFLTALDQLARAHHERGDHARAIRYARQSLTHDPLREETLRELLALLVAAGDRASALRDYQSFEQRLKEELDVEPDTATKELVEKIKSGEIGKKREEEKAALSPRAPIPQHNLPAHLTSFIGREQEIAALQQLILHDARLVTLTGPGGSGKTRLALETAQRLWSEGRFSNGAFFVRLADTTDPAFVVNAIAASLEVRESGLALLTTLKNFLRAKQLLLVIDNFEQVAVSAPVVAELLAAAPHLQVIVTSREILNLYGEREYAVAPLAGEAAINLFVERARLAQPSFTLTAQNTAPIAEICRRLDGLPLAIELAAARSKMFAPQVLLEKLTDRLGLGTSARNVEARQRTLRGTIEWSYNLLDEDERRWFARLGVLVGNFAVEAAEAVVAPAANESALERLAALAEKSVLRQMPPTETGDLRFRMLLLLREYAQERLAESGELDSARERHAHYFLSLAEQAQREFPGKQGEWQARLEAEHDNLRAALGWCHGRAEAVYLRLAGALTWFWYRRGHLSEGRRWLSDGLSQPNAPQTGPIRAKALYGLGVLNFYYGDVAAAQSALEASRALWVEAEDPNGLAYTTTFLATVKSRLSDLASARVMLEQSAAQFRAAGDRWGLALALDFLGDALRRSDDYIAADAAYRESLELFRALGDQWGILVPLLDLGVVAYILESFGQAKSLLEEGLAIEREVGDKWLTILSINYLGEVARCQGDYERAEVLYREAMTLCRELGGHVSMPYVMHNLGHVALRRGDDQQASILFKESLELFRSQGSRQGIADCVGGLAGVAGAQGRAKAAAQLFGAVDAVREETGALRWPADRLEYEHHLARIRILLDDATFATAWAWGQAMTLEQAVEFAIKEK